MTEEKMPLLGMTLNELKELMVQHKLPAFRGKQIAEWLYNKKVTSIDEMGNLPQNLRELLKENYFIGRSAPTFEQESKDGTKKYLFKTLKGDFIESVFIPDNERGTLCMSSQSGCKMNCAFCMTGRQGFKAQLEVADILNQFISLPECDFLTNIVVMGQGEPFDNIENVLKALEVITADYGYGWSPKRITVSSVGVADGLIKYLERCECHLAISLHNPIPEERAEIMPAEKAFSIKDVVNVLGQYEPFKRMKYKKERNSSHQRRLSFEYIMLQGLNDTKRHADALLALLKHLDCRVNLIRFHTIPDTPFKRVDDEQIMKFRNYLTNNGLFTTVRASRGEDIFAACGLLSTKKENSEV